MLVVAGAVGCGADSALLPPGRGVSSVYPNPSGPAGSPESPGSAGVPLFHEVCGASQSSVAKYVIDRF